MIDAWKHLEGKNPKIRQRRFSLRPYRDLASSVTAAPRSTMSQQKLDWLAPRSTSIGRGSKTFLWLGWSDLTRNLGFLLKPLLRRKGLPKNEFSQLSWRSTARLRTSSTGRQAAMSSFKQTFSLGGLRLRNACAMARNS